MSGGSSSGGFEGGGHHMDLHQLRHDLAANECRDSVSGTAVLHALQSRMVMPRRLRASRRLCCRWRSSLGSQARPRFLPRPLGGRCSKAALWARSAATPASDCTRAAPSELLSGAQCAAEPVPLTTRKCMLLMGMMIMMLTAPVVSVLPVVMAQHGGRLNAL